MAVSDRFRLEMLRDILNMEFSDFNVKLVNWATEFGFRIDGDYILFEKADIEGFIKNLDKQFDMWENKEALKIGKK